MEYRDQVQIITDIESNVPVHLITYKDTKIWPIVRLTIWQHIFDGPQQSKVPRKKKSPLKRLGLFFGRVFAQKNHYQKADAVFLVAPNERRVVVDGAHYSPFSNSARDVLQQLDIPSAMLDLGKNKLPVYGDTYFINQETVDSPILHKLSKPWEEHGISHWDELIAYMHATYPEHTPERSQIVAYCDQMARYENIFTRILKKIQPTVAFLVCYYHPAAMGYIKACRNLGIKTVEIQHGDLYGMYRDWTNIPPEGYELLPSSFWCWGKESSDKIQKWSAPVYPEHTAFVGGNPWVSRAIHRSLPREARKSSSTIKVLVALTSVPYPVDNIISAIQNSSSTIEWIIRPHPAMMHFVDTFTNIGGNVTIESSPHISLFELLKEVDFMITPCSTVAYEAIEFKVHPIITHSDGLEKFRPHIEKGLFSYADTGESIVRVLRTDRSSFNFQEEHPYMETSEQKIQNTLRELIQK